MERVSTINPNTFPKRLIPNAVHRKAPTEQKATMRIRTIPEPITEIGTMAISTGRGSTANDASRIRRRFVMARPFPDCGRAVARKAQEVLRKRRLQPLPSWRTSRAKAGAFD
jgi:hypothetical protein